MPNEPTVLLLDNEDHVLLRLRIFSQLIEARPLLRGRILAAADTVSAMGLLKAILVDFAVIAGTAHKDFLVERIKMLRQHQPDIIIFALVDGGNASILIDILFKTKCQLCLSTSEGATEVVRLIGQEITKQSDEKQIVEEILNKKMVSWSGAVSIQ